LDYFHDIRRKSKKNVEVYKVIVHEIEISLAMRIVVKKSLF